MSVGAVAGLSGVGVGVGVISEKAGEVGEVQVGERSRECEATETESGGIDMLSAVRALDGLAAVFCRASRKLKMPLLFRIGRWVRGSEGCCRISLLTRSEGCCRFGVLTSLSHGMCCSGSVGEEVRSSSASSMVASACVMLVHVGRTWCAKLSELKLELKLGVGET